MVTALVTALVAGWHPVTGRASRWDRALATEPDTIVEVEGDAANGFGI